MDDKDRFGDKLRDKEKAAEDLYIAEMERKRLERHRLAAATGSGACPRDGSKLVANKAGGVTIDSCPTCQGIWLDKGELKAGLSRENEGAVLHWVRSLFGS